MVNCILGNMRKKCYFSGVHKWHRLDSLRSRRRSFQRAYSRDRALF